MFFFHASSTSSEKARRSDCTVGLVLGRYSCGAASVENLCRRAPRAKHTNLSARESVASLLVTKMKHSGVCPSLRKVFWGAGGGGGGILEIL